MNGLLHRHVNSWVSMILFAVMTIWVSIFYMIETSKILKGSFVADYRMYYELLPTEEL